MKIRCETICRIERICAQIHLRHIFNVTMVSQRSCLIVYHDELCLCQQYENYCHVYFVSTIALTIVCVVFFFFLLVYLIYRNFKSAGDRSVADLDNESAQSKTPTVVSSVHEDEPREEEEVVDDDGRGSQIFKSKGDMARKSDTAHKSDMARKSVQNVRFRRSSSQSPPHKSELKAILDKLLILAEKKYKEARTADSDLTQSSYATSRPHEADKDDEVSQLSYRTTSNIKKILAKRLNRVRGRSLVR